MVEIRKGQTKKHASSSKLISFFESHTEYDGYFYVGYPIIFTGDESVVVDALWISKEHGVVAFDLVESRLTEERLDNQDDIFNKIQFLLIKTKGLTVNRKFSVDINVITFAPSGTSIVDIEGDYAFSVEELGDKIDSLPTWVDSDLYELVVSSVQTLTKIKAHNKRENVKNTSSRGAKLKLLEATIANLDGEQERAIIEYFEGVHRIRGLAGSGKTIVLALKAAYLHALNPHWKIAVTFHTRALKGQFKDLIERFCIDKTGELPNWDNLSIIHAWGGYRMPGIYYDFCKDNNVVYLNYRDANSYKLSIGEYNKTEFEVVCSKAISEVKSVEQKYDVILVDEAQDLSESFLKLCYRVLKDDKCLVYAYDELQKLNDGFSLGNPSKMFSIPEGSFRDTILYKCYRNSRPVLVTAHALGFGFYRDKPVAEKIVQFFDEPKLWGDVGYNVVQGSLTHGSNVVLERPERSSPRYLEEYLDNNINDILCFKSFSDENSQAEWVANEIIKNVGSDELQARDIIVINPVAATTKQDVAIIRDVLYSKGVNSHIAGDINADVFFEKDSIAFTGIYRAKGNEVPMVYIINAHQCFSGRELIRKRNTLFTGITRSKAWVRVCGIGEKMEALELEYEQVKEKKFTLEFKYPSIKQVEKMNLINRDISSGDKKKIEEDVSVLSGFHDIIKRIKEKKNAIEDYPSEMQVFLRKYFTNEDED